VSDSWHHYILITVFSRRVWIKKGPFLFRMAIRPASERQIRKEGHEEGFSKPLFSPDRQQTAYRTYIPESTYTFSDRPQRELLGFLSFYRR